MNKHTRDEARNSRINKSQKARFKVSSSVLSGRRQCVMALLLEITNARTQSRFKVKAFLNPTFLGRKIDKLGQIPVKTFFSSDPLKKFSTKRIRL